MFNSFNSVESGDFLSPERRTSFRLCRQCVRGRSDTVIFADFWQSWWCRIWLCCQCIPALIIPVLLRVVTVCYGCNVFRHATGFRISLKATGCVGPVHLTYSHGVCCVQRLVVLWKVQSRLQFYIASLTFQPPVSCYKLMCLNACFICISCQCIFLKIFSSLPFDRHRTCW